MRKILVVISLLASVFLSCSIDAPEKIETSIIEYNLTDTNGDGIGNQLYYKAKVQNTGGQRAVDVKTKVFAVYPNSREEIDSYFGNLYGGDKIILEGYHQIGAKDLRDVVIEKY